MRRGVSAWCFVAVVVVAVARVRSPACAGPLDPIWVGSGRARTRVPLSFALSRSRRRTLLSGSCSRHASRTPSETWSASLSGWPSFTDSEVKRNFVMAPSEPIAPWSVSVLFYRIAARPNALMLYCVCARVSRVPVCPRVYNGACVLVCVTPPVRFASSAFPPAVPRRRTSATWGFLQCGGRSGEGEA